MPRSRSSCLAVARSASRRYPRICKRYLAAGPRKRAKTTVVGAPSDMAGDGPLSGLDVIGVRHLRASHEPSSSQPEGTAKPVRLQPRHSPKLRLVLI